MHELSEDDGVKLLTHLAPRVVEAEPGEALSLVRAVDGLPLALTIMGNYLRRESYSGQPRRIRAALRRLQQSEERLHIEQVQGSIERHPSLPVDTRLSLWAAIDISFQALDEETRAAFRRLALFRAKPNTFSEEAALEVSDSDIEILNLLTDNGLLESSESGRYSLHETICEYLRGEPIEGAAFERMARHFLSLLTVNQKAYSMLEPEMDNILMAIQSSQVIGWKEAFIIGANDLFSFLNAKGQFHLAYLFLGQAVEYAKEIDFKEHEGRALRNLGILADLRRDYGESENFHKMALSVATEAKDHYGICTTLLNMGVMEIGRGRHAAGEAYLKEALERGLRKSKG